MRSELSPSNEPSKSRRPRLQLPGYSNGYKDDSKEDGSNDGIEWDYSDDGKLIDWTSTFPIGAVIIKAGSDFNLVFEYDETGGATSDTGLYAPEDKTISHTIFCWNDALEVSKTAETSYDRDWDWTIHKTRTSTDPDPLVLNPGDKGKIHYQVELDGDRDRREHRRHGHHHDHEPELVCRREPGERQRHRQDRRRRHGRHCRLRGDVPARPCGWRYARVHIHGIAAKRGRWHNSARVKTDGKVPSNTGHADVDFGDPVNVFDRCVNVNDSVAGPLGEVCADTEDKTFNYSVEVGPFTADECGPKRQRNGVRFLSTDDRENPRRGATRSTPTIVSAEAEGHQERQYRVDPDPGLGHREGRR